MSKFKQWDIVTTCGKDVNVEAVVDFQDWDRVYISEWWRNLNNPIRYIVPSDILYKKDKGKIVISLKEMNSLMASIMHIQNADYNHEPSIDDLKVWDSVYNDSRRYTYVWVLDWVPVWDNDWYFCTINDDDLKKLFWTREQICQTLFSLPENSIKVV